ncbi:alpha/beta fold hydrolase [Nocardia crassostreae]|uniref:alpha/beta fold hydrolase n=1 Tax=Nocardia crassostreae TaxID=53428 RepID=UPI000834333F|nr:alpha/beta hydrolase [Nocardia crassostreae]
MTGWLLLRGLTRDQRHWGAFPQLLSDALGAPVAMIDPPGFGTEYRRRSPSAIAGITDDLRDRFDPGDTAWSVLGISLGGMLAMDWCARYPGDFRRCVVVNTSAREVSSIRRMRWEPVSVFAGLSFRTPRAHESAVSRITVNHPDVDRAALAATWAGYAADAPVTSANALAQILAAARFRLPQRIPVPLLVLAATHDRLAPFQMSQRIAGRYGAPLRLHPSAGHDLPVDDGPWVCRRIGEWTSGAQCGH